MATQPDQFKPSVTPETWLSPVNACRISTLLTAARFQTLDERFTFPNGMTFGKGRRTRLMEQLREAASEHRGVSPAAADGYSREDAVFAYAKVFPDYDFKSIDPTYAQLREWLRKGFFVSISGNVDDVPDTSPLEGHVNPVPHEIGLARLNEAEDKVLVYEPMNPVKPVWVPWDHIKLFASEFAGDGTAVAIAFRIGRHTAAADYHRKLRRARRQRDANADTITALRERITTLEAALAGTGGVTVDGDVIWNEAIEEAEAAVRRQRREP